MAASNQLKPLGSVLTKSPDCDVLNSGKGGLVIILNGLYLVDVSLLIYND